MPSKRSALQRIRLWTLCLLFAIGCSKSVDMTSDASIADASVECTPVEDGGVFLACPAGCSPVFGLTFAADACIPSDWYSGPYVGIDTPPIGCKAPDPDGPLVVLPANACFVNPGNGVRSLFLDYPTNVEFVTAVRHCNDSELTMCE